MAPPTDKPTTLLCIIPISTTGMTEDLTRIYPSTPSLQITFIDGRDLKNCPPCIENHAQAISSTNALLPRAVEHITTHRPDAVLVCCFSDHPLVYALRERFASDEIPITGIFQAALQEATADGGKFGIVTTAAAWETPLTESVHHLGYGRFSAGVAATGLSPLELESLDRGVVVHRIAAYSKPLIDAGAESIILGCAGMTALEEDVLSALPPSMKTIDGVRAGIRFLSRRRDEETASTESAFFPRDDTKTNIAVRSTEVAGNAEQVV
ncbi:Asp/Glu/Hydantoin racemase [Colletotrichum orchidophilum]|uniref:Asp/Glu/Hydantoin racemase n=1 Tax=Colletotrichum orchidophilum TaxID=1209926 RepID=A0A1G4BKS7_9PEZI|nr:Asp/Glu/Hydantoin racemase [Colletotrichum orchidophilum]OHF02042.1 Asp/Glu/Hydantoin racemase [Colletotrichum orchidophilum]